MFLSRLPAERLSPVLITEPDPWLWEVKSEWEKQIKIQWEGSAGRAKEYPKFEVRGTQLSHKVRELRWAPEEENSASHTGMVPHNQNAKEAAAGYYRGP